jgi:hypothetical protein
MCRVPRPYRTPAPGAGRPGVRRPARACRGQEIRAENAALKEADQAAEAQAEAAAEQAKYLAEVTEEVLEEVKESKEEANPG